jgi:probable phosphoglycerate mutase
MPERVKHPDLFVIRHTETQWNRQGRLQGQGDSPLTLDGIRQALAVGVTTASRLPVGDATRFWVSPLGRAMQTASILADVWGMPFSTFTVEPALVEMDFGQWEGRTLEEVALTRPDDFRQYRSDPWNYCVPDGESREMLSTRVQCWVSALDASVPHVVVTHRGCARTLRGLYSGDAKNGILHYNEPQTTSYWLTANGVRAVDVSPAVLRAVGCEGQSGGEGLFDLLRVEEPLRSTRC